MARASGVHATIFISILIGLGFAQMDCGAGGAGGSSTDNTPCTAPTPSPSSPPAGLPVKHVFLVMMEDHGFSRVIGNSNMPYLNSLATTGGLAKGYHANTHPSIGNYFMLTAGQIITTDDGFSGIVTDDNIVRHLTEAGKSWKQYSENLPSVGYTGGDSDGYIEHHNPLSYFSDVRNSPSEANNLVPFSQFAADLAGHTLPDYSFIVPNNRHNGHSCPTGGSFCFDDEKLTSADNWLKTNIDPLVKSSDFNIPGGGLLIITFDESVKSDKFQGGGRVAWVIVGPNVKPGFTSTTCFQHQSTLRLMSEAIGLTSFPRAAASAPDMRELISGN